MTIPRALSSALLALGAALSPAAGCGSSNSSPGPGPDSGLDASMVDSTSGFEAAFPDTSVAEASSADAGADAAGCGMPHTGGGATCDLCVQTNCEPAWCTCAADPANVDGGSTGCLGYARCVEVCVDEDAGTPTTCFQTVCALAKYTPTEEQEGKAFLDCVVQYCAADCGE